MSWDLKSKEGIKAIFPYNFIVSMEFLCSGIQVFVAFQLEQVNHDLIFEPNGPFEGSIFLAFC